MLFCAVGLMTGCSLEKTGLSGLVQAVPKEIEGWTSTGKGDTYDEETIFHYMNGAGEIYRQYTFTGLYVRRYEHRDKPAVTLEIFDMATSKDAFGIFSHVRSGKEGGIGQGSDDTGGTVGFFKDRYFIYLQTEEETPGSHDALVALATVIDNAITETGPVPDIIDVLPLPGLVENRIVYTRSFILLNQHFFIAAENILNIDSDTEAVMAPYFENGIESQLLVIRYPSGEPALAAHQRFMRVYAAAEKPDSGLPHVQQTQGGDWFGVLRKDRFLIMVFDSLDESKALKLLSSVKVD